MSFPPAGNEDIRVLRKARICRQFVLCNPSSDPPMNLTGSITVHCNAEFST